ncbi:MAG: hypothetical protein IKU25_03405 [Clostridia bacterium]|nr:hypothetical protein [Clostridia bacterium]
MTEAIVVASIGALASVICQIIISIKTNNLTTYRIGLLEKKVEKHNNMVERLYVVEQRSKSNQHRIDELEEK